MVQMPLSRGFLLSGSWILHISPSALGNNRVCHDCVVGMGFKAHFLFVW